MEYQVIITYDITNNKLRTKIHKFLANYGINSQRSVFEMIINEQDFRKILKFLNTWIPKDPNDSVRIYELCHPCRRHITRVGNGIDLEILKFQII